MTAFKSFLANNAGAIIGVIFMIGGVATTITMQQVSINELKSQVKELEDSKVSYSVLELKQNTLNGELDEIRNNHKTLENRVRKAINNDIKPIIEKSHEMECDIVELRTIQNQKVEEIKGVWKFINKFLQEL